MTDDGWDGPEFGLPFVGDDRHELLERLVAEFDAVVASGEPRWVSLEAGTGWGKTRLVQELYAVLAGRQSSPRYWPLTLWDAVRDEDRGGLAGVERRRNLLHPEHVAPEKGAVPAWFWWGITCSTRSGTASQALTHDLGQFEGHQDALERRWREISGVGAKTKRAIDKNKGDVAEAAVGELVGAAAGLVGAAVPGLGLLVLAASKRVKAFRHGPGAVEVDVSASGSMDLAATVAPALTQLASAGIPTVIVVEDLHAADPVLVEMLTRVLATERAPVLVVTTSWPGLLERPDRPTVEMIGRIDESRVKRWREDDDLVPLSPEDLGGLVETLLVGIDPASRDRLAERFPNPLMLEIACSLSSITRPVQQGIEIPVATIEALPRDVRRLYESSWDELPEPVQTVLMAAVSLLPANVTAETALWDDRWDHELLAGVLTDLAVDASDDVPVEAFAWQRHVSVWLRRFHEPVQREVAAEAAATNLDMDLSDLHARALERLAGLLKDPDPARGQVAARIMVALTIEGHVPWNTPTLSALNDICDSLSATGATADHTKIIELIDRAANGVDQPDNHHWLDIRSHHASSLGNLGRVDDAITAFQTLLVDQITVLGPDDADTLTTRNNLAYWKAKRSEGDGS